jgi:hypothetical protein
MGLGPFTLISLLYVLIGVRVVYQLARNFRQTFDRHFTHEDRMLVGQAAFFVLLPIAVALHELGHAAAIWLFGGQVVDWGFYGFAGYVAYDPREFTEAQQIVVAAAGTAVNLLLAGIALALVFLKRPPMRAAINELLIQFVWISLLNALVVYPVLDLLSGLNGDWTQMYSGTVPLLNRAIFVIHIAILALLFWGWKSPAVQARVAKLTGGSPGPRRGAASRRGAAGAESGATATENALRDAAARVASGWPTPVEAATQQGRNGTALLLSWNDGAFRRSVLAVAPDSGGIEYSGMLQANGGAPEQRPLGRDPGAIDADRLTMMLRLAMETVGGWTPDGVGGRRSEVGSTGDGVAGL